MPPASMQRLDRPEWVSFPRSFLLTLGLLFLVLPYWVWHNQGDHAAEWPLFAWVLFWGVGVLGALLLLVGGFAPSRAVERWADAASTH